MYFNAFSVRSFDEIHEESDTFAKLLPSVVWRTRKDYGIYKRCSFISTKFEIERLKGFSAFCI